MQENIHLVPKIGKENGPGMLDTVLNLPSAGAVNHHAKKKYKTFDMDNLTFLYTNRAIIHRNFSYKRKNVNL